MRGFVEAVRNGVLEVVDGLMFGITGSRVLLVCVPSSLCFGPFRACQSKFRFSGSLKEPKS